MAVNECRCCGGRDARPLVEQGEHRWWRCGSCGFAWLDPMPEGDAVALRDGQRAHGHGYIRSYSGRKLASKYWRSGLRALLLRRHMPGRRLLDVGSNVGIMVAAARALGLDAEGIEINPDLVAAARRRVPRARLHCGTIEEAGLAPASFDGVYCSEVIEHVPETGRFIDAVARVLRPGGALFLTTPSLHEYAGVDGRWRDLGAPDHKLYFSHDNIAIFLDRHGFELRARPGGTATGIKVIARRRGGEPPTAAAG